MAERVGRVPRRGIRTPEPGDVGINKGLYIKNRALLFLYGGESGIRTHGAATNGSHDFESCAFNRTQPSLHFVFNYSNLLRTYAGLSPRTLEIYLLLLSKKSFSICPHSSANMPDFTITRWLNAGWSRRSTTDPAAPALRS